MPCNSSTSKARAAIALESKFDRRHASSDLLVAWQELETEVMKRNFLSDHATFPIGARHVVCSFISELFMWPKNKQDHTPDASWFEAMQLFDMTASDLNPTLPSQHFSHAVACWMISTKLATSLSYRIDGQLNAFVMRASTFSNIYGGDAVSLPDVVRAEAKLMSKLSRGVLMPTMQDWIRTFWTRFDAATCQVFQMSLTNALNASDSWLGLIVSLEPPSYDMSPRCSALGVCCIMMVAMGLLGSGSFRPQEIDHRSWEESFAAILRASPAHSVEEVSVTVVPHVVLNALELATGGDLHSFRDATWKVLQMSRPVLAAFLPSLHPEACAVVGGA